MATSGAAPSSVDDYLAAVPEQPRAALEALRATIRAAAPEATEQISFGMPAFRDRIAWGSPSRSCDMPLLRCRDE
jgi:uncharacterized protein YdhG (YjbR/CyaY superfamily)